jgi:hypothetical protein
VRDLDCGRVAHAGERRICAHLIGELADDVDVKAWVMRGVGAEYDIACQACAALAPALE